MSSQAATRCEYCGRAEETVAPRRGRGAQTLCDACDAWITDRMREMTVAVPDASVSEATVAALLERDGDPPRAVLEDVAVAARDDDPSVRAAAVEALRRFVDRFDPTLDRRSQVVAHLGERAADDESGRVSRRAVRAAGAVVASVVDDHGALDPDGDRADEWPPMDWVQDAFERDSEALRDAVVDQLAAVAPALSPYDAGTAARYLVLARRDRDAFPADVDRGALTALADRLDTDRIPTDQAYVVRALRDADGERFDALAVALGALVHGRGGTHNDVVETMLDRVASAPLRPELVGEPVPSPKAEVAREVLVDLVEAFPVSFGQRVEPDLLTGYVDHERDAVRAGAAVVLAAVVEHGDDPHAAVPSRQALRACLTVDDLPETARLAVLSLLADDTLPARHHTDAHTPARDR